MGLGGQAAGKVVTVQTDLPGNVDGILEAVRKILLLGDVQSVTLRDGHPITYQRFIRRGEEVNPAEAPQGFAELTPFEVVRNVPMEEWSPPTGKKLSPAEQLMWMSIDMVIQGWSVTHILLGSKSSFWAWTGIPQTVVPAFNQLFGARIEIDKHIPNDTFLLCGSKSRVATIAEIGFVLKGTSNES